MGEHKLPRAKKIVNDPPYPEALGDPIDRAIDKIETPKPAEPEAPDHLIGDFVFNGGETMKLIVPINFNADMFESAVGVLMQMRVEAERRRAEAEAEGPAILVPSRQILGPDGSRLS